MKAYKYIALVILVQSCTVHAPFQSEKGKAEYHLRQAVYHDPTLRDSTEKIINIPGRTTTFSYNPTISHNGIIPCRLFVDTLRLYDTISGIGVDLSQDNSGEVTAEVDCPPQEIRYLEAPRVEVTTEVVPVWAWAVMAVLLILCCLFYLMRKR